MAKKSDLAVRAKLRQAVVAAVAKKAHDPVLLDVRGRADVCDYLFICHGANPHQIRAIADAVEEKLASGGLRAAHREGARARAGGPEGAWIVLDYLDFLVHIFSAQHRRFYDLERLWRGAPRLPLPAAVRRGLDDPADQP